MKADLAADIWRLNALGHLPDELQEQLEAAGYAAWCVVFSPRHLVNDTPLWARFLHREFRHCYAFRQMTAETTLVINQVGEALLPNLCPLPLGFYVDATLKSGRTVLVTIRPRPQPRPFLRGPMTCVETVKSLLGIRAWWIITPRQLARLLCADGAIALQAKGT